MSALTNHNRNRKQPVSLAQTFDTFRADYDMSRESRFVRRRSGLAPSGGTADWHYRSEALYYRDIEKARDMVRNDAVIGQMITRAVANIVQDGFQLDVKTGDPSVDADLKARWNEFCNDPEQCDIAGEFTFHEMEQQMFRSMLRDGDMVALGTVDGQLQLLEAHTIQCSYQWENTVLGVRKNKYGKRVTYWVTEDEISQIGNRKQTAREVNVRDEEGNRILFHFYNPDRVTQTRGVTALAPIFSLAGMFEDINFAKLVQQQVVSCFAIFRMRSAGNPNNNLPSTQQGYGDATTKTTSSGEIRQIEGIGPGMEITGAPGEQLQGFSPNTPNAEYFSHVRLMLQLIGVNFGLPLCLVLMDGSETNFSGWRGAVDEARKGFRSNQLNGIRRFHAPVYRWKVRQWMDEDPALRNAAERVNILRHQWNPPTWTYIDPVGDAQGDILRLQNTLTSPRRLHNEGGRDWEEIANESIEDNAFAISQAIQRAEAINSKHPGQTVHWRELVSLPMPSGLQMTMRDPEELKTLQQRDEEANG